MSTQRIGIHDYTSGAAHVTLTAGATSIGSVSGVGAYPAGATPITASSGNVAAAVATATLAGAASVTTYITGFEVTGAGATAGLVVTVTVTGTISTTLSYTVAAVTGALLINTPLIVEFPVAIPASAANTSIVVSMPSLGLGNTNATVVAHGYRV